MPPEEIENRHLYKIGEGQWDNSSLRAQLEEVVAGNNDSAEFEMVKAFPQIGEKVLSLQARRLPSDELRGELILLAERYPRT
jgi:two-component system CheB/CheR fusion protein